MGRLLSKRDSPANLILLDAHKERLEFPDLKKEAWEQYRYWNPETVIVKQKLLVCH